MKKKKYFFSVIIPLYNSKLFLNKTIKSLLNQKMRDIEIILINDYSRDNSLMICKKFQKFNKNIVIINNKRNIGPGGSRNNGIKVAKGKYIIFLDSDDFIIRKSLIDLKKNIINNKYPSLVVSDSNRGSKKKNNVFLNHFKGKVYSKHEFLTKLLKNKIFINDCWNVIIKTTPKIRKIKFLNIRLAEDNHYVLNLLLKMENILVNKKVVVHQTTRMNSLKHLKGYNSAYAYLIVVNEYLKLLKKYKNNYILNKYVQFRLKGALDHLYAYVFLLSKIEFKKFCYLKKLNYINKKKIFKYNEFLFKLKNKINYISHLKEKKKLKLNLFCVDWLCRTAIKYFQTNKVKIDKIIDEDKSISGKTIMNERIYNFSKISKEEINNSVNLICHHNIQVFKNFVKKFKKNKFRTNNIFYFDIFV